eukprot:s1097_g14.t1
MIWGSDWQLQSQKKTRCSEPTNPNAHTNLLDTPDMTLLERHSWETLLGDTLGMTLLEDTLGMTRLGDTLGMTLLAWHSWEDTLEKTLLA